MLLRFDMENHERSSSFREDLLSLMKLKNFELPALRLVRGKVVFTAVYDVGDASGGKVFGSTVGDGKENISYRMGCGRTLGMRVQTTVS
mmetsp:Transcript_9840/g.14698  ORF Transcript_9840/g.14698 Transcript_9840/m.14698 type:complete len:89 (-) Transcript_9840:832-1098(-)